MAVGSSGTIDAASMASQLVAAERLAPDARLDKVERQITAQVSALGTLRSAFSALRSAVNALSSKDAAQARAVSLSSTGSVSATASAGAALGSYQVQVLSLASAQKLASGAFAGSGTAVGTGTLTLTAGDRTLTIAVDEGNNSLAGIRDAINTAAAGSGVQASIVTGDDGTHLVLTALSTGTANAITVAASGGDGGLSALAYAPAVTSSMREVVAAGDAQVEVDGFLRTSATNTLADLIPGVTLSLKAADVGTTTQLDVTADSRAQLGAIKAFANAYNIALASIATTTAYNSGTQVAAALNGDAMVRGASRELRDLISGNVVDLKTLGVTIAKDGTLTVTDATFTAAVADHPDAVSRLFGSASTSMTARLDGTLDRLVDSGGLLEGRSEGLATRTKLLGSQRTALDTRMAAQEARYRAQFTALDVLLTKMQSTSDFLTQQLASSSDS